MPHNTKYRQMNLRIDERVCRCYAVQISIINCFAYACYRQGKLIIFTLKLSCCGNTPKCETCVRNERDHYTLGEKGQAWENVTQSEMRIATTKKWMNSCFTLTESYTKLLHTHVHKKAVH